MKFYPFIFLKNAIFRLIQEDIPGNGHFLTCDPRTSMKLLLRITKPYFHSFYSKNKRIFLPYCDCNHFSPIIMINIDSYANKYFMYLLFVIFQLGFILKDAVTIIPQLLIRCHIPHHPPHCILNCFLH